MNNPRQPLTPAQALNRAAALCSRSEQAPADVRDKLLKWGLTSSQAGQVLEQLIAQGFIDESRFARAFVNDRFAFNGWGRVKIAHHAAPQGHPSADIINEAMTLIDEEQYRKRLIGLLQAKWRTVNGRGSPASHGRR